MRLAMKLAVRTGVPERVHLDDLDGAPPRRHLEPPARSRGLEVEGSYPGPGVGTVPVGMVGGPGRDGPVVDRGTDLRSCDDAGWPAHPLWETKEAAMPATLETTHSVSSEAFLPSLGGSASTRDLAAALADVVAIRRRCAAQREPRPAAVVA
jgi:hypothetical protein